MRVAAKIPAGPILLLPLVLVGCGGTDPAPYLGPRGPETFDACALFPASEARAELAWREIGQLSGPLDASSGTVFARCAYGHDPGAVLDAALEIRRFDDPIALRRHLEAALPMLRRLSGGDLAAISGVGDIAWWAGGGMRILKAAWRDLELTVTLPADLGSESPRAAAERIASRAVVRLSGEPVPPELFPAVPTVTLGADDKAPESPP